MGLSGSPTSQFNANLNVQAVCKNSHASYSVICITTSDFGHSKKDYKKQEKTKEFGNLTKGFCVIN